MLRRSEDHHSRAPQPILFSVLKLTLLCKGNPKDCLRISKDRPPGILSQFKFGANTATLIKGGAYGAVEVISHVCVVLIRVLKKKTCHSNRKTIRKQLPWVLLKIQDVLASVHSHL